MGEIKREDCQHKHVEWNGGDDYMCMVCMDCGEPNPMPNPPKQPKQETSK